MVFRPNVLLVLDQVGLLHNILDVLLDLLSLNAKKRTEIPLSTTLLRRITELQIVKERQPFFLVSVIGDQVVTFSGTL
jgi:hypothetical protein